MSPDPLSSPFQTKAPTLKVVIVCAGPVNCLRKIQNLAIGSNYQVIAVDGGYDTIAKTGLRPVFTIGDFDSTEYDIEEIRYNSEDVIELNKNKDKTDFEEALEEASYRGFTTISVFGILGGKRIDFELSNLLILSKFATSDRKIRVYSEDGKQVLELMTQGQEFCIDNIKHIDLSKTISVIPIKDSDVTIAGMEYDYSGKIEMSSSLTMSNKGMDGGSIKINSGLVYIYYSLRD